MIDLIRETFSLHNLPTTLLLGLVMFYWLLVILGVVDLDVEAGGDGALSGGNDSPAPLNSNPHSNASTSAAAAGGGVALQGRKWLSFGAVPLNVVGTVLAMVMWVFSIIGNFYLNGKPWDRSLDVALLLLVPNFLVSLVLTRILIIPFDKFFLALQRTNMEAVQVLGREGKVVSGSVTESYGQVEIVTNGAPVLLNARLKAGVAAIGKGEQVVIEAAGPDAAFYFVKKLESSVMDTKGVKNENQ